MPIILHEAIPPILELGLWHIEEQEEWFSQNLLLNPEEAAQLAQIKGQRRVEWLAARQLVHQMLGGPARLALLKDAYGKPQLESAACHLSISHSKNMAAAALAADPVGIDIQYLVPKIESMAHKYMRPEELDSLQPATRLEHIHAYWGAKEALYKAYGRRGLDFCAHIHITPFVFALEGGTFGGKIVKAGYEAHFEGQYALADNYMLVHAVEKKD
jgi:4'-phosphopantetheinyl transferase